jgi:hypothetical protein
MKVKIYVLGMVCSFVWAATVQGQSTSGSAHASSDAEQSPRRNIWSVSAEFVPTTQQYFLGVSEERRFFAVGTEFARRLHRGHTAHIFYTAELRPLIFEGDPALEGFKNPLTGQTVFRFSSPQWVVFVNYAPIGLPPQNITVVPFYTRVWTYGASVSPLGTRVNFLARRRWQPFLETSVGIHLTMRDVPVDGARSFNFTFQVGTGVEWHFRETRSWRYEFLFRHISNAYSGITNPGVDSPTIRVVYSFAR